MSYSPETDPGKLRTPVLKEQGKEECGRDGWLLTIIHVLFFLGTYLGDIAQPPWQHVWLISSHTSVSRSDMAIVHTTFHMGFSMLLSLPADWDGDLQEDCHMLVTKPPSAWVSE